MKSITKSHILNEIRRTAEANGGVPLGQNRFFNETGVKVTDWRGKIWIKWGDALLEAGFKPNEFQQAYADDVLIEKLTELIRDLGHFPVKGELMMRARNDERFPSVNVFARLGSKQILVTKVVDYCRDRDGYEDVLGLCSVVAQKSGEKDNQAVFEDVAASNPGSAVKAGYVYMALLRVGREKRYKIGKAILVERRTDQIAIQLPEDLELTHAINTDDAYGIESYWHRRFTAKRTKGEWFSLTREEVEAFKRRKFM